MNTIKIELIGTGRKPERRKRYLQLDTPDTAVLATLSADWRALLTQCVKKGEHSRWQSWLRVAGIPRKTMLEQLLVWLVKHGWVRVFEERHSGDWWPYKLEILHYASLQSTLGLAVVSEQARTLLTYLDSLQDEGLQSAIETLHQMPIARAITRAALLLKLQKWQLEGRSGTYRDFAFYARDATKAVTNAEWQWMDDYCDLSSYKIERHTCLLLLSANIQLLSAQGSLNLNVCPDFTALTPDTIKRINKAISTVATWILVENRTSFERVARNRKIDEGVIWLPGYPPSWWKEAVAHLIEIAPAPAKIACDPDPAGISIAMSVIDIWHSAHQEAVAWRMGVDELNCLSSKKNLSDFDRQQLTSLLQQDLPTELQVLAQHMATFGIKGEQEGYL